MDLSFLSEYSDLLIKGTLDTLYMTLVATFFSYVIGLPLGIAIIVTDEKSILPNKVLHQILSGIINIVRSIPFIILLIAVIPLTRMIVGTSIGVNASIVPLVLGASPFVARLVESSLKELNKGIIQAAISMGASPWQIIYKVMLPEARPSLVLGASITTITLVGYSAMAGAVGGGGLGDIAIRYGYYRYENKLMIVTIILLVVIVQITQTVGHRLSKKLNKL